jgi:hypothetical protein
MNTRLRIDEYGIIHYQLWNNIGIDIFEQGGGLHYLKEDLLYHRININNIKDYPWVIDLL